MRWARRRNRSLASRLPPWIGSRWLRTLPSSASSGKASGTPRGSRRGSSARSRNGESTCSSSPRARRWSPIISRSTRKTSSAQSRRYTASSSGNRSRLRAALRPGNRSPAVTPRIRSARPRTDSERGPRPRSEEMVPRESERGRADREQGIVELAQRGAFVLREPVRAELLDHELPQRVVEVAGIPRPALRLPLRRQPIEVRVLHEEPGRVFPGPSARVHQDRRDVATVPQERILELREPQPKVAEALVGHHLLAVVRPALGERVRIVRAQHRRLHAPSVEEVDVVPRIALVHRNVPQARVVQVTQPLFSLLRGPV